jgi:hypothetical protein
MPAGHAGQMITVNGHNRHNFDKEIALRVSAMLVEGVVAADLSLSAVMGVGREYNHC